MKTLERTSIIMLLALVLALPLSILTAGSNVLRQDVHLTNEVQEVNVEGTAATVSTLNLLGQGPVLIAIAAAVAALLVVAGRRRDAYFAIIPVTIAQFVNVALKFTFSSPRPTDAYVAVSNPASGFGFPSGHTMATVVFVGSLAYILLRETDCRWRRTGVISFAILVVLAMGFSRIYVGAHWPSDVLGAYLWGAAFTSLAIIGYQSPRLFPERRAAR